MAAVVYVDTHVAAWLYASRDALLSSAAIEVIEAADDLRVSPMVRLELHYLFEIGRVTEPAAVVVDELATTLGLRVCDAPFNDIALRAVALDFTRDPFDRLIVAQAAWADAPLVTKDSAIHDAYAGAVW